VSVVSQRDNKGAPFVGVIMGSASDLEKVRVVFETLDIFQVPYEAAVVSAHRTPELVKAYAESVTRRGIKVIIAAAGLAAVLPGVLSALVDIPVIGLPLGGGPVNGIDALLSVTNMPPGTPVGSVGIDSARNAALLAVRILGLGDPRLRQELSRARVQAAGETAAKASFLRDRGLPAWEPETSGS
jgi:phosphoribosylaminoimidazole carboxylase PurE protein